MERPLVTLIVTVYNRAGTVARTLRSILNQTYTNLDVLVVDDGSTDESLAVIEQCTDARIRVIHHGRNRGSEAAKNTGLDNIRGEWFTFVDSDDEIVPEAIETLMSVPAIIDPAVTKVECNTVDAHTGEFNGHGFTQDQYLDLATVESQASGDFWGIMRTELLQGDRFDEHLTGLQNVLWLRVRERAKEYYIHRGLLVTHRGGVDRMSFARWDIAKNADVFERLLGEGRWLESHKTYRPGDYPGFCFRGMVFCLAVNKKRAAREYLKRFREVDRRILQRLAAAALFAAAPLGPRAAISIVRRGKEAMARRRAGRLQSP